MDRRVSLRQLDTGLTAASLLLLTLLCWLYLFDMVGDMQHMHQIMPNMAIISWNAQYALSMFLMWSIMMVGMMLPSAAPAILIYQGIARKAAGDGNSIAPAWLFTTGYLCTWVLFSLAATCLQWALDQAALLSAMMVSTSATLGAVLLIAAGVYQWLPLKDACLRQCRSPIEFISSHWRTGNRGAFFMGGHHGLYCLGCCWVLMGLLFLGGVMNLLWIASISGFVLIEKLLPYGNRAGKALGCLMVAVGILLPIYT